LKRGTHKVAARPAGAALESDGAKLLAELVRERRPRAGLANLALGELRGFAADGAPIVALDDAAPRAARSLVALATESVGLGLVVGFADGDPEQPIVLGLLEAGRSAAGAREGGELSALRVEIGKERIELHVDRELVVRCGASSLTLAPDGRVIVRGTHLLSRASGSNRIKGGTVQIN